MLPLILSNQYIREAVGSEKPKAEKLKATSAKSRKK
jgi:hypothetical protein